jgi:amino acid adenylation domain-containing protein
MERQVPLASLEGLDPLQLELLRRRLQKSQKRARPAVAAAIPRVPDAESHPVSFAQQRLWFFDQWQPGSPAFNIPAAVRMKGALDLAVLARCFDEVLRRHESLRTTIVRRGEEVVQAVAPPAPVPWPLVDLSALATEAREREGLGLAWREARRPFVLAVGPLLRLTVARLAPREHLLVLVIHHIVSDAWSMEILIGEIVALYRAWSAGRPSPLAELPIQYRDYAVWQRRWVEEDEVFVRHRAYWRGKLQGAPSVVEVPTDRPRGGVQRFRGRRLEIRWPAERAEEIRRLAQASGATPFMALLAVYLVLLYRYTGQTDLVVGTLVAQRSRREIEGLIGWFANTLVLRTDLAGAATCAGVIERVRHTALDAFAHQDLPFEKLVEELNPERDLSHNVLFQMMFVLLDEVREGFHLPSLEIESVEIEKGIANFDLYFSLMLGARGVGGWVDYNVDLYDAPTVERVFAHFGSLLSAAARRPGAAIGDLPLLAEAEHHQIVREWNDSRAAYEPAETVMELFVRQARRTPGAPAVTFEGETLTYGELDRLTNRLARRLRDLGIGPEAVVGVLMERSLELVPALYAILKAGGAWLPLDPSFPEARLRALCESAGAPLVLTSERWRELAAGLAPRCLCLDGDLGDREEILEPLAGAGNLAYVIYTSGSTGQPKGVMNVHGALVNRLLWMQDAYPLDATDAVLQKTPFIFDVSVWELFWPLLVGARLVVARSEGHRDGAYLADVIRRERITTIHFVPSMLRLFLAEPDLSGCGSLKRVIASGEALTGDLVEETHRRLGAELHNLYGPTEAAIDVTSWAAARGARLAVVPIGRPIGNLRLHVLDRELRPAPAGAPGELVIGGAGLARGYRGNPGLTAGSFLPDPLAAEPGSRLYRTGDLARHRGDGTLEFLGRLDHQVKVRGLRIELGEIEAVLEAEAGVRQAVVMAREDVAHDQRLVAYVVPADGPLAAADLERALRRRLPDYMVPGAWVFLGELPLTPTGKVDRRALPRPEGRRDPLSEDAAPRTPGEERLAAVFAEVLGLERVGIHDSFFRLGGHSLLATQVLSRLRDLFGIELSLQRLFETPTVAGLALLRAGEASALEIPRRRAGEPLVFPLSFAQERLWFLQMFEPGLVAYNEPSLTRIRGPLREEALARAFREVLGRHEMLRTTFRLENGVPVQVVSPRAELALPRIDLSGLAVEEAERAARRSAVEAAREPFDLAAGPLLRVALYRLAAGEHLLLVVFHHIVADGWSYYVIVRELALAYGAFATGGSPALPALPIQYGEFARWQRGWLAGEVLDGQLAYWREQLAGAPEVLALATDRTRPARSLHRGGQVTLELSPSLYEGLLRRAREEDTTLFVLLLAAYQLLLRCHAGSEDVVVGMPVAGRNHTEIERLAGFFVNTLVLRVDLPGDPPLADLLAAARKVTFEALAHQDLPFDRLVQALQVGREPSHNPLVQVTLAFQNALPDAVEIPGLALRRERLDIGISKFDLNLNLQELDGSLAGWLEYDAELFDPATAERIAGHLRSLLAGLGSADLRSRLSDLPLLEPGERSQLLAGSRPRRAFPADARLHELFAAQAERRPDARALVCDGASLSYGELRARASRLAGRLRRLGVGPEVRVGLCVERSPDTVVGILGILEAGGAYVPLDPAYPENRLRFLVEDSGIRVLLTQAALRERLPGFDGTVLDLDDDSCDGPATPANLADLADPADPAGPESLAYVIYTSGSTGRPKGVGVTHANVVRLLRSTEALFDFGPEDVWTLFHSHAFDFSVWEIWGALAYGGTLVVVPYWVSRSPTAFHELLVCERVTVLNQTPSAFRQLVEADRASGEELALRWVIFGGEALDPRSLRPWLERHDDEAPRLVNMYGITETTVHVTFRRLRREDVLGARAAASAIGAPLPDLGVYLLDRSFRPVPLGVPGEIWVGGAGVARAYLGRPDLTAQRFPPDPFGGVPGARLYRSGDLARRLPDGDLDYQGRIDHQVKIRGFRVELGEVETTLAAHPGVRQALAVALPGPAGDSRLVAYLTVAPEPPSAEELRSYLRERLPEPMIPAAFVVLDAIPLTAHGKVDRAALPAPGPAAGGAAAAAPPRTPIEQLVAGIWAEVLELSRVGAEESFFDLGGHSLATARVASRVREVCGVDLPLRRLFELPTVRLLAAEIERSREPAAGVGIPALRPVPRDGRIPLSFSQQRVWFFDRWEPGSAVFNLATAVRLAGRLDVAALAASLDEIVRRHETLRSRFLDVDGEPVQVVAPFAPRSLPVIDLSALPAAARSAERERRIEEEARQPFDLQRGPLLRATLLRLAETEHLAVLTLHHIVSDGWSLWILTREMSAAYEAFTRGLAPALPELPIQFPDYAAWQREWLRGEVLAGELEFWKEHLAGAPDSLDLPFDRPRPPVQRYRGARSAFALPERAAARLRQLCRETGSTPFMALLTAWYTLLWRYSHQPDLTTGTVIANRHRHEVENLIGFFINTLVLRTRLDEEMSFRQALARVRETTLGVYAHQDMPFEKLVEELNPERHLSLTPLFQVMLILQNTPSAALRLGDLSLEAREVERDVVNYDLLFFLQEREEGIAGDLDYDVDLFDPATIGRLLAHYEALLRAMVEDPDRRLLQAPLLSAGERQHLLVEWNDTARPSRSRLATLSEMFAEQAALRPDARAASCGEERVTYRDLATRVDRTARSLAARGVARDAIVPVLADRGVPFLTAILAVLRCGAAYLPLDPSHPGRRIGQILRSSGAAFALASRAHAATMDAALATLPVEERPRVDALEEVLAEPGDGPPPPHGLPENLAYVIFTSGSTGQPKGVMVELRGLVNNVRSKVEDLPLGPEDVVAQTASQCFDISVWQFLAVLAAGGTVRIVPDAVAHDPWKLLQEVEGSGITVLEIVPSLLQAVLDEVDRLGASRPSFAKLRWVMPTGEAVPSDLCRRWLSVYPEIPLLNLYGPSECSDDVSTLVVAQGWEAGSGVTPVGRPLRNARVYVLDPGLEPVPVGVPGELCIGGVCVGRGYLSDPARTAASFVPDALSGDPGSRVYRTGDFARYLPDGRIDFLGRMDHQVKVRGFRIEIGEIESVLRQHEEVGQAVVVARRDGGSARLVGYVVPAGPAPDLAGRLRAHLAERLPDYMIPAVFVLLERLPLSPNGKIDRKALPAPEVGAGGESAPPRTPTERQLAEIWRQLLDRERIGIEDGFFDLGGHSLLAIQVLSRVRAALGIDLPLRELFEAPTLGALAARIDAALGTVPSLAMVPLRPVSVAEALPLSFAQERLWFLDQLAPGSPAYNLPSVTRLDGSAEPAVFAAILDEIVRRHATLRTTFVSEAGQPRQIVHDRMPIELRLVDLGALPAPARERETTRLAILDARLPFDLERGPLLRATLLRRAPREHVLLLNLHHIVSDAWSMGVLLDEISALYVAAAEGRPPLLPELPVQYADYACWQREALQGEILERQLGYWKRQLAGAPGALDLPRRRSPPASDDPWQGGTRRFRVPDALAGELRSLGRQRGTTLFMTLLAGFAALLHRYSGASDLMIGVPVAGRGRIELERLIGFFVNTLVLRADLAGRPGAEELLRRVRGATLDAFAHQDLPFERLVAEINPDRDLERSALFQVMFALQNAPLQRIELPGLELSRLDVETGTTRFELFLEMTEDGVGLEGVLHFGSALFDDPFVGRFVEHFQTLLAEMAAAPSRDLASIPLLSEAARAQLLVEWNDRAGDFPGQRPFQRLFEERAARHPDRVAAVCDGRSLTYAGLDRRANHLAERLIERGVGGESVVALLAERGLDFLTAMLGVFKAGAAYLPLDPHHPASRLRQILRQGRCAWVLAAESLQPLAAEAVAGLPDEPALLGLEALAAGERAAAPPAFGDAEGLAYVIFTSGSTGVPKGAMVVHRGMINHLLAKVTDLALAERDVVAQTASQAFDISVWQFLAPLAVGGRVEVYRDAVAHDPAVLFDRVEADGVTVLETVPSLMRLMLEEIRRRGDGGPALAALRWLIPTGEALPPELCREWHRAYPRTDLLNAYGPTECSDDVSHHRVAAGDAAQARSISIGRPVLNTRLYVVGPELDPEPLGVTGELCVGGEGVGRGYLFEPAKTAAVFVPDPVSERPGARLYRTGDLAAFRPDGNLEFLGRIDHQVKIRGFRLELGEIESLLSEHPALAGAVVVAGPDPSGAQRLAAYFVTREEVTPADLREFLKSRLPEYAIPTAWKELDELPLTPNGKVDRRALPEAGDGAAGPERPYVAPRNEVEAAVAQIFAELVGVEKVGVFDSFFDLGGHSLLATQATWRLRETFGVELALRALFEAPTVAELAGVIEDRIIEQIESLSEDEVDSLLDPADGAAVP